MSVLVIVCGALISIYFLNARLKAANDQYLIAESQLRLANQREQEASLAADAAKSEQTRAENALAEMQRAENVARGAQEQSKQALVATQAEREHRAEAERIAAQREDELQRKTADIQTVTQDLPKPGIEDAPVETVPAIAYEAEEAMLEAGRIYDFDLSQEELKRLTRTPNEVVRRLTGGAGQCLPCIGGSAGLCRRLDAQRPGAFGTYGIRPGC